MSKRDINSVISDLSLIYSLAPETVKSIIHNYELLLWDGINNAPKDGTKVWVMAEDLTTSAKEYNYGRMTPIYVKTSYHPDAGWTVCPIRQTTKYRLVNFPE